MKNNFLQEMQKRGYLNQCTNLDELSKICNKNAISGYIGFDCTASSLHVGSLLQIMILKLMQKHGHRPIVLLGGGTTLIGDPSGKDTTRKMLDKEQIKKNIDSIKKVFNKVLDTTNKNTSPVFVNNAEWLTKLKYIDFLRDVGSHFTINKMLTFDSVKLRLDREQSLSYMEFNYMILQAYDFLELNQKENCVLQIGGSDQWGNIVNGVDLIKRYSNNQAYGLTTPLITLATGAKMGKTENGAVWLDKKFLSPYDYWQFWRNTDDRDVIKFLNIFTDLTVEEIENIKDNDINELKVLLANKTTEMLHGEKEAQNSEKIARETFSENSTGSNLPSVKIKKDLLNADFSILDLVVLSKLENSKSEVRRLIKSNGVRINNEIVTDEKKIISTELFHDNFIKLSLGKKRHIKIELN
jgi:tyrosyl-tRNA synthetase